VKLENTKVDLGKPSAYHVPRELTNLPVVHPRVHVVKVERQRRIKIRPVKRIVLEDVKMADVMKKH
jgi:hypothetical protein